MIQSIEYFDGWTLINHVVKVQISKDGIRQRLSRAIKHLSKDGIKAKYDKDKIEIQQSLDLIQEFLENIKLPHIHQK